MFRTIIALIAIAGSVPAQANGDEAMQSIPLNGQIPTGLFPPGVLVDFSKGKLLQVSGQWPIDPQTGEMVDGSIQEATFQALKNIQRILKTSGTNFSYVFRVEVVLKNVKDFEGMNEAYLEYFQTIQPPFRQTSQFNIQARLEISCTAFVPSPPPPCHQCGGK